MRKLGILFAASFIFAFADRAVAQAGGIDDAAIALFGDRLHKRFDRETGKIVQFSDHILIILKYYGNDAFRFEFRPGLDNHIIWADFKAGDHYRVIAITSDGVTWIYSDKNHDNKWALEASMSTAFKNATKVMGDALYVLSSGKLWASRDTGKTWVLDNVGMTGETIADIALDAQANVYAISQSRKLWFQHRDSSAFAWRQVPGFTASGFPTALFIDRMGRMFISATGTHAQVSTDLGKSWTDVSSGVNENIDAFGDDDKGNVYAIGQTSAAYRLSNLTPPWTVISDGITSLAQIPVKEKIINSITGDSTLTAATLYGMFNSTDQGAHWTHAPDQQQSHASTFYTPLVKAGATLFLSTDLGIFRSAADGMSWEKVFPQDKYCWGINSLAADEAGALYGNFPIRIDSVTSRFYPTKSTDMGAHWDLDTLGQGLLGFNSQSLDHYVDAQGSQWLGGYGILYCKKAGEAWKVDTNGLGIVGVMHIRQVSCNNKKGIVYTATIQNAKYSIFSRAISENAWTPVNTDILATTDGILHSDQDGNLIVKALTFPARLWKYNGQWKSIKTPLELSNFDQFLTDGDGNIWITGMYGSSGAPKGLWVSTDDGENWKMVGLDGVPVKFLSSDKDTVYAVTTGSGVFKFTKNSTPAGVTPHIMNEPQIVLRQNQPNPFKTSTRIDFELPADGHVTMTILDMLGNEVAVLQQGPASAGLHSAMWNAAGISGGMYVCRLEYRGVGGTQYSATCKVVLLD